MDSKSPVHCGDDRDLDIEDIFKRLGTLSKYLVAYPNGVKKKSKSLWCNLGTKLIPGPGQNDDVIFRVVSNVAKSFSNRLVNKAIEHEWAIIRVEGYSEDPSLAPHF